MKRMMLAGAAMAALISSPALAQQVTEPPTEAIDSTASAPLEGQVTVDGVAPAQALGAIDPTKLSGDNPEIAVPEASTSTTSESATNELAERGEGNVTVQGVSPAQALGAVDPSQLASNAPAEESGQLATADSAAGGDAQYAETSNDTTAGAGLVQVAEVDVPLPAEVAEVVEDGAYSTEDLVAAQLAAIMDRGDQTAEAQPEPGSESAVSPG